MSGASGFASTPADEQHPPAALRWAFWAASAASVALLIAGVRALVPLGSQMPSPEDPTVPHRVAVGVMALLLGIAMAANAPHLRSVRRVAGPVQAALAVVAGVLFLRSLVGSDFQTYTWLAGGSVLGAVAAAGLALRYSLTTGRGREGSTQVKGGSPEAEESAGESPGEAPGEVPDAPEHRAG